MKLQRLSLILTTCLMLVGCSHKINNDHKNINKVLHFNQTYQYDLDQDGKKDHITIQHDSTKTILSINGKNAKYLYPYQDVEARLIGLGNGSKMIALTLKENSYMGVSEIYSLLDGGLHRAISSANYQIGSGYFKDIQVKDNQIAVEMYIKDPHLDVISVPMTFNYNGTSFKRTTEFSNITYITNPQNKEHIANITLIANKGIPGANKDDKKANEVAFKVNVNQAVLVKRIYITNHVAYYELEKDGKIGYLRSEMTLKSYFKDVHIS